MVPLGNQYNNIAILFFSRSAKAEAKQKQFSRKNDLTRNTQLASSLISHSFNQIKKTDLPYFHIDETRQIGTSFGERFANAFQYIFDRGFDYVISVGNDIPQLRAHHIRQAAQKLRSGDADMVFGPDADGGTWLMGYSKEKFNANRFRQLPWNSDCLLDTILEQSGNIATIALLETLFDIDDPGTLQVFTESRFSDQTLLKLIRKLLAILSGAFYKQTFTQFASFQTSSFRLHLLRGPPLC